MVRNNVDRATDRMKQLGPSPVPKSPDGSGSHAAAVGSIDPQRGAHDLVMSATDPRNLCKMDPTWQPWF